DGSCSVVRCGRRPTTNLVDYVINQGDTHHVVEHCAPFAGLFGLDPRGGRSRDGRVQILPIDLGDGHLPVPRELFEDRLVRAFERLEATPRQDGGPDLSEDRSRATAAR
ncbi:MAG: hypothetical protein J7503_08000, partial [Cellulomonas iranensis]|uniref:hypothetical protein n=1 Tax=Cellulomonas iranensis TaxID=76862 RepID=UPI001B14CF58